MSPWKKEKYGKLALYRYESSRKLANPKLVFRAFTECLKEGDHESALEILAASLNYMNKTRLSRRYKIPRRTAYNLLQRKSVPGLDLVAKVCHAIVSEAGTPYKAKPKRGLFKNKKNKPPRRTKDRPRG